MSSTTALARPVEGVPCARAGATYARDELQGHNGGLLYAQQRWLDPSTARFLSLDPVAGSLSEPLSTQGYTYAHANPTRFTDPDGRAINFAAAGVLGALGAAAGCALGAWDAKDGNGWRECAKGAAAGGAAGAVAGLTFGVGTAIITGAAATTGATVTVGAVTATTGQIAAAAATTVVGGGLSGAVGGGTSAALHDQDPINGALKGAAYGAGGAVVGGAVGAVAGALSAPTALVVLAGALAADTSVQHAQMLVGDREEFSYFELGVTGFAAVVGSRLTRTQSSAPDNHTILKSSVIERAKHLMATVGRQQRGPVLSGVMDTKSGEIFFGQNTGIPENLHPVLRPRIEAYNEASKLAGSPRAPRGGHNAPGEHSEINGLNDALWAREAATGRPVTSADLGDFINYNVLLRGKGAGDYIPPCTDCHVLTDGVKQVKP
jgi:RHS repeat-associated protein